MDKQEIFNKVSNHLVTQGKQSTKLIAGIPVPICAYRGADGTSCAAGCLIPDEIYSEDMENESVTFMISNRENLPEFFATENHILSELQLIHDNSRNWGDLNCLKQELRKLAISNNLSVPEQLSYR
jgi:hypothetical protein